MLQDAEGERVTEVGQTFVVHMDRESLGDLDLGRYDVTVTITAFEPDREIAWTVLGRVRPQIGHVYGYRARAGRRRRQPRHVVLRLVRHRPAVARGGDLPGDLRGQPQGDPGHPGPDRTPRLPAGHRPLKPARRGRARPRAAPADRGSRTRTRATRRGRPASRARPRSTRAAWSSRRSRSASPTARRCARPPRSRGARTRTRAWWLKGEWLTERCTYSAGSGCSRGLKRHVDGTTARIRSRRKVRQSSRSTSQAMRYHRRPGGDEADRLDPALGGGAVAGVVPEADAGQVAAGAGQGEQHVAVDQVLCGGQGDGRVVDRLDLRAQPRRHHLVELGERAERGLAGAGHGAPGGQPQGDRDRHGLGVVEQQRRQLACPDRAGSRRRPPARRAPGSRARAAARRRAGCCAW